MFKVIVQFKRYWSDDIEIAQEHFPRHDEEKAMLGQFIRELNQEKSLMGCWNVLSSLVRPIGEDKILYIWVEFDVDLEEIGFKRILQNVYDEYGMSGFYEVLSNIFYPTVEIAIKD
jgi:hypothetical protein